MKLQIFCVLFSCALTAFSQTPFERFRSLPVQAIHDVWVSPTTDEKWVAGERGLVRLINEEEQAVFRREEVLKTPITCIRTASDGKKWLSGYSSNLLVENEAGEFVPFDFSQNGLFLISDMAVDKRNQAWVATLGGGLWKVNARGQIEVFNRKESKIKSDQVYTIAIDNRQTKWIGTDEGLESYSADGRFERERFMRQTTALRFHENELWAAGLDGKWRAVLWRKNTREEWEEVEIPSRMGKITDVYFDPLGNLWLAGARLAKWNKVNWEIFDERKGFTSKSALCVSVDAQENVWVGTEGKGLLAWLQYPAESSVGPISAPQTLEEVLASDELEPDFLNREIKISIQFEQSQAKVLPRYFPELDRLARILEKFPRLNVELAGHTDNRGQAYLNQKLSYRRAEAVKNYLVEEKGIDYARIQTKGYGGSRPIADNSDETTRKLNRRVTVRFLE